MKNTTLDSFLDGKLQLSQPRQGYRAGTDAVLLASSVRASSGMRIADVGSGVGAVGLCLAVRLPGLCITLLENQGTLLELAQDNIAFNQLTATLDVSSFDVLGVHDKSLYGAFDQVVTNPPYFVHSTSEASPNILKAHSHHGEPGVLQAWITVCHKLLKPKGVLNIILPPDRLSDLLEGAPSNKFGQISIIPVWSNQNSPALRLIVHLKKGSKTPLVMQPGIVLYDEAGAPTTAAAQVTRQGGSIWNVSCSAST